MSRLTEAHKRQVETFLLGDSWPRQPTFGYLSDVAVAMVFSGYDEQSRAVVTKITAADLVDLLIERIRADQSSMLETPK